MSKFPLTVMAVLAISGIFVGLALAGDLGISINIGEPGFYGQVDIGDFPQPRVIYSTPVLIERAPGYGSRQPIYLHVPPGHEKHWNKYCGQYHACGQPVYFVQDGWYQQTYAPYYREHKHGSKQFDHQDGNRGEQRGERHDDNHD